MKFLKHLISTFLTTILIFVLGLVSSVIIARSLGPTGQGVYTLVMMLPALILILTNLGISRSVIYHLSKGDISKDLLVGNFFITSLLIIVLSIISGFILIQFWGGEIFPHVPHYLLFLGLVIVPLQLLFSQFYSGILYGLQKINTNNIFNIIQSITILLLLVLLVILLKKDISGALLATMISLLVIDIPRQWDSMGLLLELQKLYGCFHNQQVMFYHQK